MRVEIVTITPDAGRARPPDHAVEVGGEVGKVEVAVMVDEHGGGVGWVHALRHLQVGEGRRSGVPRPSLTLALP